MPATLGKSSQRPLQADTTGDEVQRSVMDLLSQTRQRIELGFQLDSAEQDEVVHQTRVDMKRLRALWYLVRPGLNKASVKRLHSSARDVAGALSGQRDHAVMLETLDSLDIELPEASYRDMVAMLGEQFRPADNRAVPLDEALALLDRLQAEVESVDWPLLKRDHLLQGLIRTGVKGEDLGRLALQQADVEALHRWRKWVKAWMYQLNWLQPEMDKRWMLRLKPLGSALGRIHDLDVLVDALRPLETQVPQTLSRAIIEEREALLEQVSADAQQVYAKRARRRARKVFRRWYRVRSNISQ